MKTVGHVLAGKRGKETGIEIFVDFMYPVEKSISERGETNW